MDKCQKSFHLGVLILLCIFVIIVSILSSKIINENDTSKMLENEKIEENTFKGRVKEKIK